MRESLVRRLLAFCVVAVAIFAAFAAAQNSPTVTATASSSNPISAPNTGLTANATVIADGIAVRSLAVDSISSSDFYVTNASALNRVFLLSAAPAIGRAAMAAAGRPSLLPVAGVGQAGSLGDGGEALAAQLDLSADSLFMRSGIAIASDGTIFIADTKNSTIRSIGGAASSEPSVIRSVAGRWAPRQNVTLSEPIGIALDRAGNLYIADHSAGVVDALLAATGKLETLAHLISPASIAVTADGSKVFVASPETGGVFSISTETRAIAIVPGFAAMSAKSASATTAAAGACAAAGISIATGTSATQQVCPAGLAVDRAGNLFVADANAGKILRVDAKTNKTTITASSLSAPGEIVLDSKSNLYVAEQGRSRIISLGNVSSSGNLSLTVPAPPAGCTQGASFTFCNEPVGGKATGSTFTLANTSATTAATAVTVAFNPATTPGNFSVTSTSCTPTLPASGTCTINVAFTPEASGALSSILTVTDSASDSPSLTLAGTGDDYSVQLASGQTNELTVAQGGTVTYKAVIVADGTFGANGEKVTFVCPSNLPQFTTCSFNPCPLTVVPGASTPFNIVIVTSSATVPAPPVTPCSTQAGGVPSTVQGRRSVFHAPAAAPARDVNLFSRRFPTLAAVLVPALAILLVICVIGSMMRGATAFALAGWSSRPRFAVRVPLLFAMAGFAALLFLGCGGKGTTKATNATPIGVTNLTILGNATDANGNSLGASRSLQFILDVVAGK
jgi:sugar lactone lactonase YvrE